MFLYELLAGGWDLQAVLGQSEGEGVLEGSEYGYAVSMSPHGTSPWGHLAVGAPRRTGRGVAQAGGVFVYQLL